MSSSSSATSSSSSRAWCPPRSGSRRASRTRLRTTGCGPAWHASLDRVRQSTRRAVTCPPFRAAREYRRGHRLMDRYSVRSTPPPVSRREEIARAWTASTTSAAYIPRALAEIEELLLELVDQLLAALAGDDPPESVGMRVGARLVHEGFIDPAALQATIDSLTQGMLGDLERTPDTELARRTVALLGALSAGFADGLRSYTLTQQEQVKQALFAAMVRTENSLRATENRFREVFTSSA